MSYYGTRAILAARIIWQSISDPRMLHATDREHVAFGICFTIGLCLVILLRTYWRNGPPILAATMVVTSLFLFFCAMFADRIYSSVHWGAALAFGGLGGFAFGTIAKLLSSVMHRKDRSKPR